MKVLMVINNYPTPELPSSGSFIKSQIDSIRNEGIEVDILFINALISRFEYLKAAITVFKKSWKHQYDLIHAHYGFCGIIARMQWRVPVLVSFMGDDILGSPLSNGRRSLSSIVWVILSQILSFFIAAVIVKSFEMKKKLLKKTNVFVIPNGVDFKQFRPISQQNAKTKLALNQKKKYVLFPSRPEIHRKCYPIVNDAVQIVKKKWDYIELITLHSNFHEIVPYYMNACDIMVLASYWEGSPNVIKEGMACNIPIVSVDVGDVKEIIGSCTGCEIVRRNAIDIANALEMLLNKPKRTHGREMIHHLEIQKVAKEIIGIYNRIIKD